MFNMTINQGWQCPRCQRVYSPTTPMCWHCVPVTDNVTTTTETFHEKWCASMTQLLLCEPPKPAPCNCKEPK